MEGAWDVARPRSSERHRKDIDVSIRKVLHELQAMEMFVAPWVHKAEIHQLLLWLCGWLLWFISLAMKALSFVQIERLQKDAKKKPLDTPVLSKASIPTMAADLCTPPPKLRMSSPSTSAQAGTGSMNTIEDSVSEVLLPLERDRMYITACMYISHGQKKPMVL